MKTLFKSLILGTVLLAGSAFAGEPVDVTWTHNDQSVEYSGYKLFWTDSSGVEQSRIIPDATSRATTVLDVPYGPSSWYIRSLCENCIQTESDDSAIVTLDVKSKGVPSAPNLSVSLGN